MVVPIRVPDFGVTGDTLNLHRWLVAEGEVIVRGQTIAEIEGDKAVVILESVANGVLLKIVAAEGGQVSAGDVIAFAGDPTDTIPETRDVEPDPQARAEISQSPVVRVVSKSQVSPILRNFAKQKGVDIDQIIGTGKGGVIIRADIIAAAGKQDDDR